jgi:hypothetical protein
MSLHHDEEVVQGFADGWTAFLTTEGLDVLLRTSAGESKGRLGTLNADGDLEGTIFEPGSAENALPLQLVATPVNEDLFQLRAGKRVWALRKPAGKSHYFAFLNQWPAKAEPVDTVKAMLAKLKKQPKA